MATPPPRGRRGTICQVITVSGQLANVETDLHDVKLRLTSVEEGQAGVHRRLDRLDERMGRIERRLDLADA